MLRIPIVERPDWRQRAKEFGFTFHTLYGEPYWDESAYYQFTLRQIEDDIEDPTHELHQMCLAAVERVCSDEMLLKRFQIPEHYWSLVTDSWRAAAPSLYSRFDFIYDGSGPAKFLENNADTPTSLYESGFWQWLWLEEHVDKGTLPRAADQFNSLQEKLVNRLNHIRHEWGIEQLHFSCCKDTDEDRGTVQYLQDCATEAGIQSPFVFIEDIGIGLDNNENPHFTDLQDRVITDCFKLYPWEFMFREAFGEVIPAASTRWIEPPWKSILSNKALLPLLWDMFPNHPNLLPAFFIDDIESGSVTLPAARTWVKKPLFSREGANISIIKDNQALTETDGPYGEEGFIVQAHTPMPEFNEYYTLIGSWLVDDQPAGISIREDSSPITQDLSRYLPHIILD